LGVGLLAAGLIWAFYQQKSWAWAVAAGLLTLVPSTSVAMLKEHMAEHRAYLLGAFLLLGGALAWPSWGRKLGLGAMLLGVLLLPLTHHRNQIWADEVNLWKEATEVNPESAEAWYGLGDGLRFADRCTEAVPAYKTAIDKDPTYLDGWNNLGICLAQTGDTAGAGEAWREALRRRPSYCKAHVNLGSQAYQAQNWEEAMVELRSALAWCPENAIAHWLMGNIYYGPRKDRQKALIHYQELVKVDPRFPHAPTAKERILQLTW
jgi:tetratricopeptide (TPR) repeat protein